jgi:opacity protein-like surface antigen
MITRAIVIAGTLLAAAGTAGAQSLQRLSVQGSGALVFPTASETAFKNTLRLGWEGQLRYTISRFSVGAGYQRSTVYKAKGADLTGAVSTIFVEPRYVVRASSRTALYLAGRVGASQLVCNPPDCADQSWEAAYGGGAGLLYLLSDRVSLDLGTQYFATRYTNAESVGGKTNAGYVLARLGMSVGI